MAETARTNTQVYGKETVILIKKPGGSDYILFGCITSADYDSGGAELDELACRSGVTKSPSSDIALPVLSLEHLIRMYPSADQAANISDDEVVTWVETAQVLDLKYSKGTNVGDIVKTGPVVLNGYSGKGPQKGPATGAFKANFLSMPVRSVIS